MRCKPSQVMVQIGMNLLVRGFVNQDLTVAESKRFPPTDLGDNFGMLENAPLFFVFWFPSYSLPSNPLGF